MNLLNQCIIMLNYYCFEDVENEHVHLGVVTGGTRMRKKRSFKPVFSVMNFYCSASFFHFPVGFILSFSDSTVIKMLKF